jgi:CTP synthase
MQVAAIGAARLSGLKDANSTEFNPKTKFPVVTTMAGQEGKELTGGTMRLGNYDCKLEQVSLAHKLYGKDLIQERHRHRYELDRKYLQDLEKVGLVLSGTNPETNLPEIIEADKNLNHPFYIAAQFHPEFTSRPTNPQPLFNGFIESLI